LILADCRKLFPDGADQSGPGWIRESGGVAGVVFEFKTAQAPSWAMGARRSRRFTIRMVFDIRESQAGSTLSLISAIEVAVKELMSE
jgi:hypothetical protein